MHCHIGCSFIRLDLALRVQKNCFGASGVEGAENW